MNPLPSAYFITGTDTGVGKTLIAAALLRHFAGLGRRTAGMKPVASGSHQTAAGLRNEDALLLQKESSVPLAYEEVNPYVFEPAIAPHLAAAEVGVNIELPLLMAAFTKLAATAEVVVVEGAGGWRVPIGPENFLSDLPERLGLGVIVVVGLRLGCLNHAVLTCEAIGRGGSPLLGWIGNGIDPQFGQTAATVETLKSLLPTPCLGIVPPLVSPTVAAAAARLEIPWT